MFLLWTNKAKTNYFFLFQPQLQLDLFDWIMIGKFNAESSKEFLKKLKILDACFDFWSHVGTKGSQNIYMPNKDAPDYEKLIMILSAADAEFGANVFKKAKSFYISNAINHNFRFWIVKAG